MTTRRPDQESTGIKIKLVTRPTHEEPQRIHGHGVLEDGSREVVRVALLGPDGPTGTFTCWGNERSRGDGDYIIAS